MEKWNLCDTQHTGADIRFQVNSFALVKQQIRTIYFVLTEPDLTT